MRMELINLAFICGIQIFMHSVYAGSTDRRCPDGFFYVGEKCYNFYRGPTPVARQTASEKCNRLNSKLASIEDGASQTQLVQWINRHEYSMVSYWIGLNRIKERLHWDDEDALVTYTAWDADQPSGNLQEKCVIMSFQSSLSWKTEICEHKHFFICETNVNPGMEVVLRSTDKLESFCKLRSTGYYAHPANCKKYILCYGTKLLIYNCRPGELFSMKHNVCQAESSNVVCKSPVTDTTSAPSVSTSTENCIDCDDYQYEYGTEDDYDIEVGEDSEETAEPITIGEINYICENTEYAKFGKKCYKVFSDPVQWSIAKQICLGDERGRLVMIKSKREQQFISRKLNEISAGMHIFDFWIGLNDQNVSETFVWSDGSILSESDYQNWSRTARKRHKELKKCIAISLLKHMNWKDEICSNEYGYICEKDAINTAQTTQSTEGKSMESATTLKERDMFCGNRRRIGEPAFVIGGQIAPIEEHPWQVSLRTQGKHKCGGSLIDSCWVLTAAHCIDFKITDKRLPTLAVIGDFDTSIEEPTERFARIEQFFIHPDWTTKPVPTNDIGLIKLGNCVNDVTPICLPGSDYSEFASGTKCKVTGWGTLRPDISEYPTRLQEAVVPLLEQNVCERSYRNGRRVTVTSSMFCAGYLEGGIDACQGDSGGPLVCTDADSNSRVQWGIVSWGFGCARRNKPGVYTHVSSFMNWIRDTTKINF